MKKPVALITGASSGIGRELAKVHASKGGDLVIVARREERLNELKDELESNHGCHVAVLVKDLSVPESRKEIFDYTESKGIEVDYLINNAGFGALGPYHEQDWQRYQNMIEVNITALSELTWLYLKPMTKRNSGKIMNVSSVAGFTPGPRHAVYFATKAYVTSLSEALAEELRNTDISVTALCPGFTDTEFAEAGNAQAARGMKFTTTPDKVAEYGYRAMIKGKTVAVEGIINKFLVAVGIRTMPRKLITKVSRFLMEKG
jgi:uncharacterized protein